MNKANNPLLLSIMELGGYPDFSSLYQRFGYRVEVVNSMRKAARLLKQQEPDVIVTEFNFQSDFRDRTSSLETLMAMVQRMPSTRVIVFYEKEYQHQFERVRNRFAVAAALPFPVSEADLQQALEKLK